MMSLESLANELLLDILEFLTTKEILRAFHGLNHRFDVLLPVAFENMGLDFRSLTKREIITLSRAYLPSIIDHTRSLRLIDANGDRSQTGLIPFHDIALPRFHSLQSLSFFKLCRGDLLEKIIDEVAQLPLLTQLNFVECHMRLQHETRLWCIDSIWGLPKLTHCRLDLTFENETHFTAPTIVSVSLRHLVIDGPLCRLTELAHLLDHTPSLRYLYARISAVSDYQPAVFSPSSLTKLRLFMSDPPEGIHDFFQSVPQLSSLTVETTSLAMDGNVWQQIMSQFLPKLQRFRLNMNVEVYRYSVDAEDYFSAMDSFGSQFWVEQHRWFIKGDYYQHEGRRLMRLYTLPYDFNNFHIPLSSFAFSSGMSVSDSHPLSGYQGVQTLCYYASLGAYSTLSVMPFMNIHHLHIILPCDVALLSLVSKFERLRSLNITIYPGDTSLSLQVLLKRATHLQALTIASYAETSSMWLAENEASVDLRCIDLLGYVASDTSSGFDKALCREWIQSSIGRQCEILSITVQNRFNILQLLHGMANLQTLIVHSKEDSNDQCPTSEDELVDWLKARVPLTCTVQRDPCSSSQIRVWKA